MLPLEGGEAAKIIDSPFTDWVAAISPDERLVAYVSDETGSSEVYVRSLASGSRVRVSQAGGGQPRWRRDGRELFFVAPDNTLMSAAVGSGGGVQVSAPTALFTACVPSALGGTWSPFMYRYDVSADGSRSVWLCPAAPEAAAAFVTVNWDRAVQDTR
jgi:Tol biopolymer transport system component